MNCTLKKINSDAEVEVEDSEKFNSIISYEKKDARDLYKIMIGNKEFYMLYESFDNDTIEVTGDIYISEDLVGIEKLLDQQTGKVLSIREYYGIMLKESSSLLTLEYDDEFTGDGLRESSLMCIPEFGNNNFEGVSLLHRKKGFSIKSLNNSVKEMLVTSKNSDNLHIVFNNTKVRDIAPYITLGEDNVKSLFGICDKEGFQCEEDLEGYLNGTLSLSKLKERYRCKKLRDALFKNEFDFSIEL